MKNLYLERGMSIENCRGWFRAGIISFLILICFGVTEIAYAKSGKIVGQVVSKETGEPVIGATVMIKNTSKGNNANIDGDFIIQRVDAGTYTVVVSAIGYSGVEIAGVTVADDKSTELNVALEPQILDSGTRIKVTAKALQNSEANLLRSRAKSPTISDAISAETMSRSGSGDAADAVERVTGATVVDGSFVYVRGLGGRYGNAQLNGSAIPTADPDNNAVPMDLFPTNLLDNITVSKTATADKAGNFSGGSVDLQTKDLSDQMTLSFSSSVKYDTEASWRDDFLAAPRSSTDWLALDDGMRDIPELFASDSLSIPSLSNARSDIETAYRLDTLSRQFKSTMTPERRRSPLNQSYAFSFGNNYSFLGRPVGFLASATYSTDYDYYNDGRVGRYTAILSSDALNPDYYLVSQKGQEKVAWGGLVAANYSLHQNHKLSTRFMYTRDATQSVQTLRGEVPKDLIVLSDGKLYETRNIRYVEQDVKSYQLSGEHFLRPLKVEWQGSISNSRRDEPDVRDFSNEVAIGIDSISWDINELSGDTISSDTFYTVNGYGMNGNLYPMPSHYFRAINEDNYEGRLDFELPLAKLNGKDFKIKIGTSYLENTRKVNEKYYKFRMSSALNNWNGDPDYYFSDDYMGITNIDTTVQMEAYYRYTYSYDGDGNIIDSTIWFDFDPMTGQIIFDTLYVDTAVNYDITFGSYVAEETGANNNFTGIAEVFATYAMTEFDIVRNLHVVTGVRFETTDMSIEMDAEEAVSDSTRTGNLINVDDWLPSASLTYAVTNDMNLRLAYGKTLARPTVRELSPMITYEFVKGNIYIGNPDLKRTLIDNYDFRWEWFTSPGELIAASTFYKRFENPIERAIINNNNQIQYKNVDVARVYGAEFEIRENLGRVIPSLGNFNFGGNLTLIKSEVKLSETELLNRRAIDSTVSDTRPLQGQSNFIVNASLNYNNIVSGTDITLLYNIFGERLSEVSEGGVPDVYEQPRHDLDLTISQRLMTGLKLKTSVKNILGSDMEKSINFKGKDYTFARYSRGTSFSIGLSYSI